LVRGAAAAARGGLSAGDDAGMHGGTPRDPHGAHVLLHADLATTLTLIAPHLVAAAIVIPALGGRLETTGTRGE
jgi:hypothetical protein